MVNEIDYNFTSTTEIENLVPGNYTLCIKIANSDFKQCYELTINKGISLSGNISVGKKSADISVTSGTAPYTIFKNGDKLFETHQTNFSVDVVQGDAIEVKSKASCQGLLSKKVNFLENIKAYPNPSNGLFDFYIPNSFRTINVEVYNIHSQLLSVKELKVSNGKVNLNITDKPTGVYFIKLNIDKPTFLKLIKK